MIEEIIDGISLAINAEFGDEYEIYTESVEQGLTEPCFSVRCINPNIAQFVGRRYRRTNQFAINYFPRPTGEEYAEINGVTERLYSCLEYITVDGDLIMGTGMECNTEDKVLHFFVNYNYFSYSKDDTETMEEYDYNVDTGG